MKFQHFKWSLDIKRELRLPNFFFAITTNINLNHGRYRHTRTITFLDLYVAVLSLKKQVLMNAIKRLDPKKQEISCNIAIIFFYNQRKP